MFSRVTRTSIFQPGMNQLYSLTSKAAMSTQVTAAMIKELRAKTSAPMMDCKKALQEANGDVAEAAVLLRKQGMAAVDKKAHRVANSGLVAVSNGTPISDDWMVKSIVEVNSETDFVARNETFQQLVNDVADTVAGMVANDGQQQVGLKEMDLEEMLATPMLGEQSQEGMTVQDAVAEAVYAIGENIQLRRAQVMTAPADQMAEYVHGPLTPNAGKIAGVVALHSDNLNQQTIKELAIHVVGMNPANKQEMSEQQMVTNPDVTVADVIGSHQIEFVRLEVGEGME